jgi:hypothetical protein
MRIKIVVEEVEPLCGQVSADDQAPVAFSGWLPLLRILERLTASAPLAPQRLGDQLDP